MARPTNCGHLSPASILILRVLGNLPGTGAVFRGFNQRKDVIYVRSIWFFVMFIIRAIPERIFKRLKL